MEGKEDEEEEEEEKEEEEETSFSSTEDKCIAILIWKSSVVITARTCVYTVMQSDVMPCRVISCHEERGREGGTREWDGMFAPLDQRTVRHTATSHPIPHHTISYHSTSYHRKVKYRERTASTATNVLTLLTTATA